MPHLKTVHLVFAALLFGGATLHAQNRAIGFGTRHFDSGLYTTTCTAIAAGTAHAVALRADGTLAAWGDGQDGKCDLLAAGPGLFFTRIAAGSYDTLGLRSDGTIAARGRRSRTCPRCPQASSTTPSARAAPTRRRAAAMVWS